LNKTICFLSVALGLAHAKAGAVDGKNRVGNPNICRQSSLVSSDLYRFTYLCQN